ncbi:MAG: radical SAM protein [archaeon]
MTKKVNPGKLISPPELIHQKDDQLPNYKLIRPYDKRIRLQQTPKLIGKRKKCPFVFYDHIFLCGDDPESHRWGVNLKEADFYEQIEKLGSRLPIIIGVRRTNFFKLDKILSLIAKYRKIKPASGFSIPPFHGIKKRFYKYLDMLQKTFSKWNIAFKVTDKDLVTFLERIDKETGFDEREGLIAIGPVCKDVFSGPEYLLLNLNGTCNTDCIYCRKFSPIEQKMDMSGKQSMDIELLDLVLHDAKKMNVQKILIVGEGEPTLHPNFREALGLIKKHGLTYNMSTNGMVLGRLADIITNGTCTNLTVSMSWSKEDSYSKIRPGTSPKFMNIVKSNIKKISSTKKPGAPTIILLHAINKHNFREIIDMAHDAKELGADYIWYQLTHLSKNTEKELKLTIEEMNATKESLTKARLICKENNIGFNSFIDYELEHYNPKKGDWSWKGMLESGCLVGWHFVYVDFRGLVSFCCGTRFIGDLRKDSLEKIWYSPTYKRFRNDGIIMHIETPIDLFGKPLYDDFCKYCDNHDQHNKMHALMEKFNLIGLSEGEIITPTQNLYNHAYSLVRELKYKIKKL